MSGKPAPICPKCGRGAIMSQTQYGERAKCCGLWSWGRKELADRATHAARIQAHDAFDAIWKGKVLSRGECYRRLRIAMNMTAQECHMSIMSEADALRVVAIVKSGALLAEEMAS